MTSSWVGFILWSLIKDVCACLFLCLCVFVCLCACVPVCAYACMCMFTRGHFSVEQEGGRSTKDRPPPGQGERHLTFDAVAMQFCCVTVCVAEDLTEEMDEEGAKSNLEAEKAQEASAKRELQDDQTFSTKRINAFKCMLEGALLLQRRWC